MPYTHLTFTAAKQLLATRLGETSPPVFWTDTELGEYIKDALRHWGLIAQYWKDRAVFDTVATQPFYSLHTEVATLRGYTVLDHDLIRIIQYHLMEPAAGTSWTGSEQFTFTEVLDSITRCRNKLLLETGCTLQVDTVTTPPPPVGHIALDDNIIDVRRVAWNDSVAGVRNLRRNDTSQRSFFAPRASYTPATPTSFTISNKPHVSIELIPAANNEGVVQLVTCRAQEAVTGLGTLLGIPDDFVPTLKWGVLADLLSSERASDSARSEYCEARWQEGLQAAKLAPSFWSAEIEGRSTNITSLAALDSFTPNWQNVQGEPSSIAATGLDLIALSPIPDGVYSVRVDVTRKAPIPTFGSDYVQLGREYIEPLLDYCVHLATFKQGGDAFFQTKALFENFMAAAATQNSRLKAESFYLEDIGDQALREQQQRPRSVTEGGVR